MKFKLTKDIEEVGFAGDIVEMSEDKYQTVRSNSSLELLDKKDELELEMQNKEFSIELEKAILLQKSLEDNQKEVKSRIENIKKFISDNDIKSKELKKNKEEQDKIELLIKVKKDFEDELLTKVGLSRNRTDKILKEYETKNKLLKNLSNVSEPEKSLLESYYKKKGVKDGNS